MNRNAKKDYLHPKHIARTYYDERGRVSGQICDDYVTHDPEEERRIIQSVTNTIIDAMVSEAIAKESR